jgi:hypothetical protein
VSNDPSYYHDGPMAARKDRQSDSGSGERSRDEICGGFTRMMTREFLALHRRARQRNDEVSMKSLDAIIAGFTEMTEAVEAVGQGEGPAFQFNAQAFDIFSNLAKNPNDPLALGEAGAHYLIEWRLPHAALHHLERAQSLKPSDLTISTLIEVAAFARRRANSAGRST